MLETEPTVSAEVEFSVVDEIRQRKSLRAFADKPVPAEVISTLFEAARWAPSSVNEQPWRYVYATRNQQVWQALFEPLNDSNKVWAQQAPLLVASLAKKTFTRNGKPNVSARYDVGAANAFLSIQATRLGLNIHQMGGFDKEKAEQRLRVPTDYEVVVIMAIGYPGDANALPEPLRLREQAPRTRNRQSVFVYNRIFD
jgi:nitroreductase